MTTLLLDDGRGVSVRPIRPDDAPALVALHRRLSPETVRRRFFGLVPELPPPLAERLATVDGTDRAALVAEVEDRLVAVARYDVVEPGVAEIAVVVADDHQHHHLGTLLLERLLDVARAHDVRTVVADVLADNGPMLATLRDLGLSGPVTYASGVAHLVMPVPAR